MKETNFAFLQESEIRQRKNKSDEPETKFVHFRREYGEYKGAINIFAIKPKYLLPLLDELMRKARIIRNERALRERFIVGFLFWTGVRVGEFKQTKRKFLDFENEVYNVPELKAEGLTPIPLVHVPKKELDFWKLYFDFCGIGPEDYIIGITVRHIQNVVKWVFVRHLFVDASPKALRHSLGYFLATKGFSDKVIAKILRCDIRIAALYPRLDAISQEEDLQKVREEVDVRGWS